MSVSDWLANGINTLLPGGWRLVREQALAEAAPASPVSKPWEELSRQGLFVIGHARTGTTVLQDALNDSRAIFLFNEPDFHSDPGTPDFRQRHNAMHRRYRNQETKGTFCPDLFGEDRSWDAYFARLCDHYRYVGSKVTINPNPTDPYNDALLNFCTRKFYDATYIFTFRDPLDVTVSTRGLVSYQGHEPPSPDVVFTSFLSSMLLCMRMLSPCTLWIYNSRLLF